MLLPQKILKKKLIIAMVSVFGIGLIGTIVYVVNDYYNGLANPPKKVSAENKDDRELPSTLQKVDVEVNNYVGDNKVSKTVAQTVIESKTNDDAIAPPTQSTKVTVNNSIPSGNPAAAEAPVSGQRQQAQQPKKSKLLVTGGGTVMASNSDKNFISQTNTGVGTGTIDSQLSQQASPYTLFAGGYIPITMQSGLNSEQRGQIVAMVSRDVYDTATGKFLLIPQGSKVVGTYDNNVAYGQKRLIVGWNRLIYPDHNGTSVLLHGQPGTSLEGFAGFDGSVDNHYVEIYGSAFLIGGIMGAQAAAMGNQGMLTQPTSTETMSQQVGNQMAQTGLAVVQKGLNIPPTIIISPGYRGYIALTSDLVLKPYARGNRS